MSSSQPEDTESVEPFIKGPFGWNFWSRVAFIGANPLRLGMGVKFWSGFRRGQGITNGTRIGMADGAELGLGPRSARTALRALEAAGLCAVERKPGCKPVITLLETDWHERPLLLPPPSSVCHTTLARPICWSWWYRASPLSDPAIRVALVLWFCYALPPSRERWTWFKLSDLGAVGLSRYSAGRGLRELSGAGLVGVVNIPGQPPQVAIIPNRNRRPL